jgi:hypothetical protein
MRITARDDAALTLQPLRWQFPAGTGPWDDEWLVIGGHVVHKGRGWSFTDPCLLIGEARELTAWLRAAAVGTLPPDPMPDPPVEAWEPSLCFLEPVLGFSLQARDVTGVVICAHLSLEAAPPWPDAGDYTTADDAYTVRLHTDPAELLHAADDWEQELNALPTRTLPPHR